MNQRIESFLAQPKNTTFEFKECRHGLNKNVYETVFAFLNRHGGTVLLGVDDSGTVSGIDPDQVRTENSNKPHSFGLIDPALFSLFPKNPVITRFFKEISRADELGSGIRNLMKYGKAYGGVEYTIPEKPQSRLQKYRLTGKGQLLLKEEP